MKSGTLLVVCKEKEIEAVRQKLKLTISDVLPVERDRLDASGGPSM